MFRLKLCLIDTSSSISMQQNNTGTLALFKSHNRYNYACRNQIAKNYIISFFLILIYGFTNTNLFFTVVLFNATLLIVYFILYILSASRIIILVFLGLYVFILYCATADIHIYTYIHIYIYQNIINIRTIQYNTIQRHIYYITLI